MEDPPPRITFIIAGVLVAGFLVLLIVLLGTGGGNSNQTSTITTVATAATTTTMPRAATTTTASTPADVRASVIQVAQRSVLPVHCDSTNSGTNFLGNGFMTDRGVISASHVVAACPPGAVIGFGEPAGTVAAEDPSHDLARLSYQSTELITPPLLLQAAPATSASRWR